MITLIFGILIEWVNKFWRVAPVYFAGVLLGSLTSSVFDPYAGLVGSSGGVYAILGSHLALVIMNWEEMQHDWTNCTTNPLAFMASGVVRLVVILIILIVDFAFALYRRYALQQLQVISFMAHLGGFLAGILIGIPILRNFDRRPWERILFWVSLTLFIVLVIFAILWNIFFPNFPPQTI
ncbi:unnamed protein product [Protopolystoma xenopodis]|uniref:Peptidase S54 rhomboid domain-containing protein n=1 Tax=Protopolystoma xenopodis TaxID=117903 RepID=A0A3S5BRW5_9PLAT|nr:unnamed protein product [Protopolystoma xenopodis]